MSILVCLPRIDRGRNSRASMWRVWTELGNANPINRELILRDSKGIIKRKDLVITPQVRGQAVAIRPDTTVPKQCTEFRLY